MEEAQKPRWYVVTCYSRQEEKVRNDLIKRAESADVTQLILDVRIVKKREIHDKTGKEQERNLYPGYLFAYMTMNDEAWYIVRNTPGVTVNLQIRSKVLKCNFVQLFCKMGLTERTSKISNNLHRIKLLQE